MVPTQGLSPQAGGCSQGGPPALGLPPRAQQPAPHQGQVRLNTDRWGEIGFGEGRRDGGGRLALHGRETRKLVVSPRGSRGVLSALS